MKVLAGIVVVTHAALYISLATGQAHKGKSNLTIMSTLFFVGSASALTLAVAVI